MVLYKINILLWIYKKLILIYYYNNTKHKHRIMTKVNSEYTRGSLVQVAISGIRENGVDEDEMEDFLLHRFGTEVGRIGELCGFKMIDESSSTDFCQTIWVSANEAIAAGN